MILQNQKLSFDEEKIKMLHEISQVTSRVGEQADASAYVQCTQNLFKLLEDVKLQNQTPQELLFYTYSLVSESLGAVELSDEHIEQLNTAQTCLKLLQSQYLSSMGFSELENLVKVDNLLALLLQQLSQLHTSNLIDRRDIFLDFYCTLLIQFWLDNSCFENQLNQLFKADQYDFKMALFELLIDKLDVIVQTQQNGEAEEHSETIQMESKDLMIENQTIYKTLSLFQNSALLQVFEFAIMKFLNGAASKALIKCLTQCIRLYELRLSPGKNQMMMKLTQSPEIAAKQIPAKIQAFCSIEIVSKLVVELQSNSKESAPVFTLLVQIVQSDSSDSIFRSDEICQQLLDNLLNLLPSLRLDRVCMLFRCINAKCFHSSAQIQKSTSWLTRFSEVTEQVISNYQEANITSFNNILKGWAPILDLFQKSKSLEEAQLFQPIVKFVSEKISCFFMEQTCSQIGEEDSSASFKDDDTFIEHLESANTKSIKEIVRMPVALAAMSGQTQPLAQFLLVTLKELSQDISQGTIKIQKCQQICWLLHVIRIYFCENVSRLESEDFEIFEPIVEQRLQAVTMLGSQVLKLEELLSTGISALSQSDSSEAKSLILQIKYAQTKCILSLSKSLLSQKLKQRVQQKIADEIASYSQMTSRNEVLQQLISFSLLQIEFLKESSSSEMQSLIFEQTLKFLVHLTITKPYIEKDAKCMHIKQYFTIDFNTLVQLKDYLKQQLSIQDDRKRIDFKRQRLVVVSLTTLMCEFDTLSSSAEVLADIYQAIQDHYDQLTEARKSNLISTTNYIYQIRIILNNLRGLFEGAYRTQQFMWLLHDKFLDNESSPIKNFIQDIVCADEIILLNDQATSLDDKVSLSKSILKLVREMTNDRDQRIQFNSRMQTSLGFTQFTIKVTYSCLGVVKQLDVQNGPPLVQDTALKILKQAIQISLQLAKNECMSKKKLDLYPELRDTFTIQLSSLLEGLRVMISPSQCQLSQLNNRLQKQIYEFIHYLIERHFGLILHMSRKEGDSSFFSFVLSIISEGLQTTQSTALLYSFDCIESMHNYAIKGSKFYREALRELLNLTHSLQVFKKIAKLNLRSFLRREQTNRGRKILITLQIVNMYRLHHDMHLQPGEPGFYEQCAAEVSNEYQTCDDEGSASNDQVQNSQQAQPIFTTLIGLVQSLNWQTAKMPQLTAGFKSNLETFLAQN